MGALGDEHAAVGMLSASTRNVTQSDVRPPPRHVRRTIPFSRSSARRFCRCTSRAASLSAFAFIMGRKPPFLCVKRPARPYKSPIQKQIYIGKR
jgi:hypothetical protein